MALRKVARNRFVARTLLALLLFIAPGLAPAQSGGGAHTRASLVTDVGSVRPGSTFTVGVRLRMDPGWHTYWKNSGEAGLPTDIRWTLPAGFTAGAIQWPLPEKKIETGDVLTFGYGDETVLLVPITAPSTLAAGSNVVLVADVSWLECEAVCVPGEQTVRLTLPAGDGSVDPARREMLDAWRSRVPSPWTAESGIVIASEARDGVVEISVRPGPGREIGMSGNARPDFYPETLDGVTIGRTAVTVADGTARMRVPLSAFARINGPRTLRGVTVFTDASGNRRGVATEIQLAAEFTRTIPVEGEGGEGESRKGILDQPFTTTGTQGPGQPLWVYLAFAVIGGLLLNVMPCVLPVIALKVFGLVKMAGDEPRRARRLGWAFSAGVMASFLLLALLVIILQFAGSQVGWGFQFQEPLFVIAMSAVVFAFGLSLFGVYEIMVPGAAVSGVGSIVAKQGGKGFGASFWEGVFATVLATPCTAPFLGSALGFAFSQPPATILLIFAAVAFGMALPYLVFTSKPALLKFLPKPGRWMETAKQFMGFLMMATVLWLQYVLGKQLGMEAVIWTSAFLLAVGIACWLIGKFATLTATRGKAATVWAAALVIVASGYMVFLESILDVRNVIAGSTTAAAAPADGGVDWQPFTLGSLEKALADGKPVFVDFTAEWCLTCKVNERTVLANEEVVKAIASGGIVPMKADWTNRNPEITRLLQKFGRSGVPLYVVFPAGRPREPIVLPEVITPSIVLDAIGKAVVAAP